MILIKGYSSVLFEPRSMQPKLPWIKGTPIAIGKIERVFIFYISYAIFLPTSFSNTTL